MSTETSSILVEVIIAIQRPEYCYGYCIIFHFIFPISFKFIIYTGGRQHDLTPPPPPGKRCPACVGTSGSGTKPPGRWAGRGARGKLLIRPRALHLRRGKLRPSSCDGGYCSLVRPPWTVVPNTV